MQPSQQVGGHLGVHAGDAGFDLFGRVNGLYSVTEPLRCCLRTRSGDPPFIAGQRIRSQRMFGESVRMGCKNLLALVGNSVLPASGAFDRADAIEIRSSPADSVLVLQIPRR